jgi:hypothetical protein
LTDDRCKQESFFGIREKPAFIAAAAPNSTYPKYHLPKAIKQSLYKAASEVVHPKIVIKQFLL